MLMLTATAQPDYIALGIMAALFLVLAVAVIRKKLSRKNGANTRDTQTPVESTGTSTAPTASGSAGQIKLHDVEPKTAAMLMAIVADKMGKPLNELRFISIKEVK